MGNACSADRVRIVPGIVDDAILLVGKPIGRYSTTCLQVAASDGGRGRAVLTPNPTLPYIFALLHGLEVLSSSVVETPVFDIAIS
jgi:hypothetical protein